MNLNEFEDELTKINIKLTNKQKEDLLSYYKLVIKYNEIMNLTGITEIEQFYLKHFYDSLTLKKIENFDENISICDIGSGAGFPGIVLKIVFPNLKITLLDSLGKRVDFLNNVISELKLTNIVAIKGRAEDFGRLNRESFDLVTARAVSHLSTLLEYSIPILKVDGKCLIMKGNLNNEIEESKGAILKLNCEVEKIEEFFLPKENSNRTLIKIVKKKTTNLKYPRMNSEILKKRL